MKKMDEIMELLTEEIEGFTKAIDRLEHLTKNVGNIQIEARTWEVEKLLNEHLRKERDAKENMGNDIRNIGNDISRARIVPKFLVYILVAIWGISLVTICILGFKVSQMDAIRQEAYEQGRNDIVFGLRGYFDENPEVYKTYTEWKSKIDSTASKN